MYYIKYDNNSGILANPDIALKYKSQGFLILKDDANGEEASEAELLKSMAEMNVSIKPTQSKGGEV